MSNKHRSIQINSVKSGRNAPSASTTYYRHITALLLGCSALVATSSLVQAQELPTGGRVVYGSATIKKPRNDLLLIEQVTGNAILEFDTFSIGAGKRTHFDNGSGSTLTRVTGGYQSKIDGSLTATGDLLLINPNGVIVGRDGAIETGGDFLASTRDITNADFLDGSDQTFTGTNHGVVVNYGKISSLGGDVTLLAHKVVNEGHIEAKNGSVGLAAGIEILLRDKQHADGRILVRAGQSGNSVDHRGSILAAEAELRAHGGNVYALAQNTKGAIHVTGASKRGGRLFLTANGGAVRVGQPVRVKRRISKNKIAGGQIFINAKEVTATGLLDVSGIEGGSIDIGATKNIALNGADLNSSGVLSGGTIRVGGEFQGGRDLKVDEVTNVANLTIDMATSIDVSSSAGKGGEAILWSNERTKFAGSINASGGTQNEGGFVEISSAKTVNITGDVHTGGGTFLIDPEEIVIANVDPGFVGTSFVSTASILAGLATGNVVVSTDSAVLGAGSISVNDSLLYSSIHDLTLLAMGNIFFESSIQNSNAIGGDINVVAGWDGITGLPIPGTASFDFGTLNTAALETTNIFGRDALGGGIFFGTATGNDIAVGSRAGQTRVYTHDLVLGGDGELPIGYSQLGFVASDQGPGYLINGDISVRATGAVDLFARPGGDAYAQIGHVGADIFGSSGVEATVDSDITVEAIESVGLIGGDAGRSSGYSYAQIGHGGHFAEGSFSGNIDIVGGGALGVVGGSSVNNYAQVGHGGGSADGTHRGNISISQTALIVAVGGDEEQAYAQIGHGGEGADGDKSGDINISGATAVGLLGGFERETYAQIGHGGDGADGNINGDISINADLSVAILSGFGLEAYAQIGHGGDGVSGDISGNINVTTDGFMAIVGNAGQQAYAQLGHGSADIGDAIQATGTRRGNITVSAGGELDIENAGSPSLEYNYGWLGHASGTANAISNANVRVEASAIDDDVFASVAPGANGFLRADITQSALNGGNVRIKTTNSGLVLEPSVAVSNSNDLQIETSHDIVVPLGGGISNSGSGNIVLAAGRDFHNDSGTTMPISTGSGRWAIYSTRPDNNRQDIEITNADYLKYGQTFNSAAPLPTDLPTGNGLVYSVMPILSASIDDQTIEYGSQILPTPVTPGGLTVNGAAVNLADFGISDTTATTAVKSGLPLSSSGRISAGSYADALIAKAVATASGRVVEGIGSGGDTGDLTVTPLALTITADAGQFKTFGDPDPAFTFSITMGSLLSGDTLMGTLTREVGEDVGLYDLLLGSLSAGGDYIVTYVGNPFEILTNERPTPNSRTGGTERQEFQDPVGHNSDLFAQGNCSMLSAQYGPAGVDGLTSKDLPATLDIDCPIKTGDSSNE